MVWGVLPGAQTQTSQVLNSKPPRSTGSAGGKGGGSGNINRY